MVTNWRKNVIKRAPCKLVCKWPNVNILSKNVIKRVPCKLVCKWPNVNILFNYGYGMGRSDALCAFFRWCYQLKRWLNNLNVRQMSVKKFVPAGILQYLCNRKKTKEQSYLTWLVIRLSGYEVIRWRNLVSWANAKLG